MIADRNLSHYLAQVRHAINAIPDESRWEQETVRMDTALGQMRSFADVPDWMTQYAPLPSPLAAEAPDHTHQFVAERCLVCGCGEPENPHGENLPTMPRDPALRLSVTSCPDCGRTVSEPDGAWYIGMTCPDCGHVFTAQDETAPVLSELRAFRADILRAMEY